MTGLLPKGRVLEFREGGVITRHDDLPTGPAVVAGYRVDATADPRRIDLDQAYGGKKALGIYTIDKDEVRRCYAEPGAARPTKFESKPGDRVFLLVLKRVKE